MIPKEGSTNTNREYYTFAQKYPDIYEYLDAKGIKQIKPGTEIIIEDFPAIDVVLEYFHNDNEEVLETVQDDVTNPSGLLFQARDLISDCETLNIIYETNLKLILGRGG